MIKTFSPKLSQISRGWQVLDASGQTLGRLASRAAIYLRGKHKPTYAPHMDMGDHVVIVNAAQIRVTGNKLKDKIYYRHSGYPGGLKSRTLEQELARFPSRVIERAVRGMLPRNALGEAMHRKLHVYAGPEHPHQGQVIEAQRAAQAVGAPPAEVSAAEPAEQPAPAATRRKRAARAEQPSATPEPAETQPTENEREKSE